MLICLSSVMPASWSEVCDREGTLLKSLIPAALRETEYIGRPTETSQSVMEEIFPGDTGFRQISVRPPLGICSKRRKKKQFKLLFGLFSNLRKKQHQSVPCRKKLLWLLNSIWIHIIFMWENVRTCQFFLWRNGIVRTLN